MKILPNRNKFNPGHDVTKIKENKERRLGEDEDKERKRKGAASWKKMERERERERERQAWERERESTWGLS